MRSLTSLRYIINERPYFTEVHKKMSSLTSLRYIINEQPYLTEVHVCVVSVIVKRPVLPLCVVDGRSRNPLYYYYYYYNK